MVEKMFNKVAGDFLKVKSENMRFAITSGEVLLKKAEIKTEMFEGLHMPFVLKGGYCDLIKVHFPSVSFFGGASSNAASVEINNVFLIVSPHVTTWDYEHVFNCKTKLIDLFMRMYEMQGSKKKKKKKGASKGWMADMMAKKIEDIKKAFLGMLEVHISNIHFRFEDPGRDRGGAQEIPFACGFKIGMIDVNSTGDHGKSRVTGDWRGVRERFSDPLFRQVIQARRISAYWDIGEDPASMLSCSSGAAASSVDTSEIVRKIGADAWQKRVDNLARSCPGQSSQDISQALARCGGHAGRARTELLDDASTPEFCRKFVHLNIREAFSACVVDEVLRLFGPDHKRRKYLEGPTFRERLDFHRYVILPMTVNAHVIANRPSVDSLKAPQKDADICMEHIEVVLDSEQIRSVNELLVFNKEFAQNDALFLTRPRRRIADILPKDSAGKFPIGGGPDTSRPPWMSAPEYSTTVRGWWHHAAHGVRLLCKIPKSHMTPEDLRDKTRHREFFIETCVEDFNAQEMEKSAEKSKDQRQIATASDTRKRTMRRVNELQMEFPLQDCIAWRNLARAKRAEKLQEAEAEEPEADDGMTPEQRKAEEQQRLQPSTLQAKVQFKGFQAFLLIVADQMWGSALAKKGDVGRPRQTRQLVVRGQVDDLSVEVVQKGRAKHRVARWMELGIGSISAVNCTAKKGKPMARQLVSFAPIEHRSGSPICVFVGFNTLEVFDSNHDQGDVPLAAVVEASRGVAAHLREVTPRDEREGLEKLGMLKDEFSKQDQKDRVMWFVCVRAGQGRFLDHTPFRRRLLHCLTRGSQGRKVDLRRQPSPAVLDRELLVKLQRRVEALTGKSNMLGVIEGVTEGVRLRSVDLYNRLHVLCKEVTLAPVQFKALRNGNPQTFHMQFHQKLRDPSVSSLLSTADGSFGLLPWKYGMLLLPKDDFAMGMEGVDDEDAEPGEAKGKADFDNTASDGMGTTRDREARDREVTLDAAAFLKWGRNGRSKRRFVAFDETSEAVVWRDREVSSTAVGAIPLSKFQDILTGISTPVLQNVGRGKVNPDLSFSIITEDRTLDLQAESKYQRDLWVGGLKARYKRHMSRLSSDPAPAQVKVKEKVYPERFRSDRAGLRAMYKKLQLHQSASKGPAPSSGVGAGSP